MTDQQLTEFQQKACEIGAALKLLPQDEKLQDIIVILEHVKQGQEQPVIHLMLDYIQQA